MKEMIIRAIRTFFQAFIGFAVVNLSAAFSGVTDGEMFIETLGVFLASGIAAGLAAIMNMPKKGE